MVGYNRSTPSGALTVQFPPRSWTLTCRRSGAKEFALLEIRVLGGLEVVRDGVPATLPPSRKTRALLAYLALTRGRHRREQLCDMFWDVPDDPRGSLRWSLSKIRPIVDEVSIPRLLADRQSVELRTEGTSVDFLAAQSCAGLGGAAADDLTGIAKSFRGPLLSDLDLPENSGFHTWLLGMREDARKLQAKLLRSWSSGSRQRRKRRCPMRASSWASIRSMKTRGRC